MVRSLRIAAVAVAFVLVGCLAGDAQEPKKDPPGERKGFQKGRFGGGGGFGGGPQIGQILPPFMFETLKLTDDQKKEVEALQKEVDAKLAKILTDEQQKQLKDMRERGGGFGGRGPGGPGGRGPGGRPDGKGPPDGGAKKKDG